MNDGVKTQQVPDTSETFAEAEKIAENVLPEVSDEGVQAAEDERIYLQIYVFISEQTTNTGSSPVWYKCSIAFILFTLGIVMWRILIVERLQR